MVYIEKLESNGKTYYYVTKVFRVGNKKWKKIRRYIGSKPPSEEQKKKAIEEIETEALEKGIMSPKSQYKYLDDKKAEKLQEELLKEMKK